MSIRSERSSKSIGKEVKMDPGDGADDDKSKGSARSKASSRKSRKNANKIQKSEIVQPFEKPLPHITKMTTRNMVTKLELPSSDVYHMTTPVASKVFNLDFTGKPMADPKVNQKWHLTDEVYNNALKGYNDVIAPFEKFPRVYKLLSTKEKMFAYREAYLPETIKAKEDARIAELKEKEAAKNKGMKKSLSRLKSSRNVSTSYLEDEAEQVPELDLSTLTEEQRLNVHETELNTIIDPFQVPFPWVRRTKANGEVVYVNEETKAVKSKQPGEVWEDKFSNLERLTPREDFSAWDYRENDKERRKRFKIQGDFERKMMREIERRENEPNDLEQVEDALFYIIDTIAKRDEKHKWIVNLMKKNEARTSWHPNTLGFRLDPLEFIKSEGDPDDYEGIPRCTDLEFNDNMIVSATGHVLATLMPWNLMDIHEKEREIQRELERVRQEALLAERNKPLKEKFTDLVEIAREDGSSAAMAHLGKGLKNRAKELPEKIPSSQVVVAKSKNFLVKGKQTIANVISDPESVYTEFRRGLNLAYFKIFPPSEEAVMLRNMMKDMEQTESQKELLAIEEKEAEAARKIEARNQRRAHARLANIDMSPKPAPIPDTTLITLTLLVDPPPLYDKVPPPTWYDPATAMALHFQKELLGIEEKQQKYRKPPRFLNARSSLEMYKNWENIFLRRQLATDEDYEYASLASSLHYDRGTGGDSDGDSGDDSDEDSEEDSGSDEDSDDNEGEGEKMDDDNDENVNNEKDETASIDDGPDNKETVKPSTDNEIEDSEQKEENKADEAKNEAGSESDEADVEENTGNDDAKNSALDNDEAEENTEDKSDKKSEGDDKESKKEEDLKDKDDTDDQSQVSDTSGSQPSQRKKKEKEGKGTGSAENNVTNEDEDGSQDNSSVVTGSTVTTMNTKSKNKKRKGSKNSLTPNKPLPQYQLKAIAKQLWANYKDKHAGAAVFIKDVYDETNRKRFENTLLDEVSTCACIPQKFFSIEEIRKLPPNHDLLLKLKKEKQDFFDEEDRQAAQKLVDADLLMQENLQLVAKISAIAQKKREEEAQLMLDEQSIASDGKSKMSFGSLLSRATGTKGAKQGNDKGHTDISLIDENEENTLSGEDTLNRNQHSRGREGGSISTKEQNNQENNESCCSVEQKDTISMKTAEQLELEEEEALLAAVETEEERKLKIRKAARKGSTWGSTTQEAMSANEKKKEGVDRDSESGSVGGGGSIASSKLPGSIVSASRSVPVEESSSSGSVLESAGIDSKHSGNSHNSISGHNLSPTNSNGLISGSNSQGNSKGHDHTSSTADNQVVTQFSDPRFPTRLGSFVGVQGNTPLSPRQLCITMSNPEHERHDPNHWMAKQMRPETDYEKQLRRIEYLKVLQLKGTTRVQVLKERIRIVQQKQQELNEIAEAYLGPTLKVVKKVVKPLSLHIQKKSLQCAKDIAKGIRRRRELAKLGNTDEDNDAIVMGRRKQPAVDVAVSGAAVNEQKEGEEREAYMQKEEFSVNNSNNSSKRHSAAVIDKEDIEDTEDKEVTEHALNVVTTATEAAAIALENKNSAEEAKHREMLATLRDKLEEEEAALLNDLESNSTIEEREQAEEEERIEKEQQRLRSSSGDSSLLSQSIIKGDENLCTSSPSNPPPPLPFPSSKAADGEMEIIVPELSEDEQEVMSVLNVMCHTIIERIDERYDVYDEYLDLWDQKERPDRVQELIGCQVSIMVHVDDSLKQNMYLYDLQSQDIAVMLSNQLWDRKSTLNTSPMTKHIIGVEHKSAFSKRQFKEWEHLWVHILSPTYFRYCTKPSKKERFIPKREPGRLKSGVILVNPTDSFDENQKAVFMGMVQPKSKFEIDDPNAAATLNFDVDDIGAELYDESGGAKLVLFRPKLNTLTKRELEKCKRIYRGFLDKYNAEMTFGLARGGLRANQYSALKDMETSKRIYDLAKQSFNRNLRAEQEGPAFVPQITNISAEQMAEWQKEAKEEEAELLREKKLKKIQQGALRKQEAEMRRRYNQQKNWMLSHLLKIMPNSGQELSTLVQEEFELDEKLQLKLDDSSLSERERSTINNANSELKKTIISEEKLTRVLFGNILKWFQSERAAEEKLKAKEAALTAEGLRQLSSGAVSRDKDADAETMSNISRDSALQSSVDSESETASVTSSRRSKNNNINEDGGAAEPVPKEKVIEYLTNARERYVLDQKYFIKLAEEQRVMALAEKRQRRMNKMEDARKMLEFSYDVSKKKKSEEAARKKEEAAKKKEQEEREAKGLPNVSDEQSVKSEKSDSSSSTTTSLTDSQSASISIAKLKLDRFKYMKPEVARFTDKEMEILPDLLWFKLCLQHKEFYDCCKELPLLKTTLWTRDELVQFAKICAELSPFILRAKDKLKKKRDEVMNKKALKGKRFHERHDKEAASNKPSHLDTEEEAALKAKEEYRRLLADGLAEEAEKRKLRLKAAQKRRKRREKAWLYAHQHMFIKVKGKPPFCVICRDKMDLQWLDAQEAKEKKHLDEWEGTLAENLNAFQEEAKKMVEADYLKEMEEKKKLSEEGNGGSTSGGEPSLDCSSLQEPTVESVSIAESSLNSKSNIDNVPKKKDSVQNLSSPNSTSRSTLGQEEDKKSQLQSQTLSHDSSVSRGNEQKNTTPSTSARKNFLRSLSSRFSKSNTSVPPDNNDKDGDSVKSCVNPSTTTSSVPTSRDEKVLLDSRIKSDDDLSHVSESKSEVSKGDSFATNSFLGRDEGGDSLITDNTQSSSKDEVYFAGRSEYSGDLGSLRDPDDIDALKDFAQMSGNVVTKGYGKKKIVDRSRTRRRGMVKAAIPLPDYMIEANLPAIDPNGVKHVFGPAVVGPIELTEEQEKQARQVLSRKKSSIVNDSEDGSIDPDKLTVFDEYKHEILLKVWNYDFEEKGDFLGYVLIPNEFIANPTKGIRKFPLLTDPNLVKPTAKHLALHGDLFLKLIPTRKIDVRINKPSDGKIKPPKPLTAYNESESDSDESSVNDKEVEEKPPEAPPKLSKLSRFMSYKQVHTKGNMVESVKETKEELEEIEAEKKRIAEELASFQGPCSWKFQILKGVKLTPIDNVEKSSPFVEVLWKGNCTKKNNIRYERDFQTIGYTSVKKNTVDPDWKNDKSAMFEFPPIWTTVDLPGRGESLKEPLKGGGYVAKNHVPENDPSMKRKHRASAILKMNSGEISSLQSGLLASVHSSETGATSVISKNKGKINTATLFKQAVGAVMITNALGSHTIENLEDKMAFKTKVRKALVEAEEVERRCMAREERRIHIHFREKATAIEAVHLVEQKLFEKNFSRLMQHLQNAPPILGRVRFLMSNLMKGGGTCTMCQDPSTHKNIDVYAIPIMYEEDEIELGRQVQVMLGRQHNSIIQILNFSVHQVLGFSMTGHASLNERVAMVVCKKDQSVSLLEHIQDNYYSFTDSDFRIALMQITNALMAVHRDGLVHRNIHPEAVHVKIKGNVKALGEAEEDDEDDEDDDSDEDMASVAGGEEGKGGDGMESVATKQSAASSTPPTANKSLRNHPTYILQDFWFLHNPRKSGCEYSLGRADWGNTTTMPPEALGGNIISDKSDIWGLGISVYMWATRGLALNVQDGNKFDFNEIAKKLPLKWGPWVLSFLRMCLERNPKFRASASDLYQFLVVAKPINT